MLASGSPVQHASTNAPGQSVDRRAANGPARLALAFAGSVVAWVVVATIGFELQSSGFAPVGLFSLLVGGLLGAAEAGIWRIDRGPARKLALAAALAGAPLVCLEQDYLGYWRYTRDIQNRIEAARSEQPLVALVLHADTGIGPASFGEYQARRLAGKEFWWWLDFGLTTAAAAAVAWFGTTNRKTLTPALSHGERETGTG